MNILIVKLSSLGDVVQTMPVIADLKQAFPDCQIDWVVEEAFAPLVARVQGVNRVIPIALRRWRKDWFSTTVRQERKDFKLSVQSQLYEAVIDCQGLIKSALVARLARLTGRALRGSFANKSDACGYEWPVKFLLPNNQATPRRIHAIARTRLLTAKLLDYQNHQPAQVDFQDLPTQTGDHQTMMLTHGTTRSDNEWPLASWIELVAKCVVAGYRIVVPQANDAELQFAKALQKQFPEQLQILPRLNLSQLLDEMVLCTGVIGVDAGPSHMAVALGLPHVQIFSHDRAWRAGPLPLVDGGAQHQVAVGGTYVPSVDQVWQAWLKASSC